MSITGLFKSKSAKASDNSKKGNLRQILSKISGAFMLPISVMSIAGLFLGVGAAIASNSTAEGAKKFGEFIQTLGDPVFAALPVLFAIAFVIAFTDEAGVAVFATIIGYLIFVAVQQVFITESQTPDKQPQVVILFEGAGRSKSELVKIVGKTLGFTSLQTSVFGGIAVGMIVQYLYNKFHTIQLPQIISFFGGKRFVALVTIPAMALLAIVFLIFWPWVGIILNKLGAALGRTPYGFDSLIFGYIERSLIPFGLHHVFYSPLWYTSVGGDAGATIESGLKAAGTVVVAGENTAAILKDYNLDKAAFQGDSTAALKLLKYGNFIDYTADGKKFAIPLFTFLQNNGMKIGRFADGKFSGMMFGLPAAAAAMVWAAPKENRKVAIGTVFPAALTSFVTGVTEPIEFTFLFLSPLLFWGFHAVMMAISFWLANLLGVHIPMAFSGGALDMLLYGIVPVQKGTNFWWPLLVGIAYVPIYFFGFLFIIKWQNLETPGRGKTVRLFTKKDYLNKKDGKTAEKTEDKTTVDPQVAAIVEGYGGVDNIVAFNNCASRLRYDIKDLSKVSEEKLKAAGAVAIKVEGANHVQAIMGPVAEQLNAKIKSQISLLRSQSPAPVVEEKTEDRCNEIKLYSPSKGKLVDISAVQDGVFSDKLLGDGFAIQVGETGKVDVYAPIDGKITVAYPTKHAFGIVSTCGALSLLIHIGVDTVKLDGLGFTSHVEVDQVVSKGDKISTVDLDVLKANGIAKTDVIVVALSESAKTTVVLENTGSSVEQATLVGKVL